MRWDPVLLSGASLFPVLNGHAKFIDMAWVQDENSTGYTVRHGQITAPLPLVVVLELGTSTFE